MAHLARFGPHDVRDHEADLGRREELAGALSRAFRKLAQQVFVCATEEVGLYVSQPQAVARIGKGFDDAAQFSPD